MRILLTADPYLAVPPKLYGGIERIVASLLVKLKHRGHTVGLVAISESTVQCDYFRAWHRTYPKSPVARMQNSLTLLKAANDFGPAVVHSFSRIFYLTPLLTRGFPKIMSYQRAPRRSIRIAATVAGRSLTFTGCSEFITGLGRAHGGTWHSIPNFVDADIYDYAEAVPDDAPLVFLSRIDRIKGAHVAIKVAKKTGRRLIIAGNHAQHGPGREYWDDLIKPELGNGIEYVGAVDDTAKAALLRSALAMIVPIQWDEPFGIVFIELLACGTPVISCPRGALPEIVRHGLEGFLVKSVDEACEAVGRIATLGRANCRRRFETEFSADVVSRRYEQLYEAVLQR